MCLVCRIFLEKKQRIPFTFELKHDRVRVDVNGVLNISTLQRKNYQSGPRGRAVKSAVSLSLDHFTAVSGVGSSHM